MKPAVALRIGVLLGALATMALVVVFARLFSALLGAELVLWAPGLALFGGGLGATWVGLRARSFAPPRLLGRFGVWVGSSSLGVIAATIAIARLAPPVDGGQALPLRLVAVALFTALPFFLVGVGLAAAHAHARIEAPRLAAFDLVGAALALPLSIALLRHVGAPRAALLLAILLAANGVFCATVARTPVRGGQPAFAWGLLLGALSVLAGDLGAPWLKLTYSRGVKVDRAEFVAWSELGLVTVDIPSKGATAWIHTDGVGTSGVLAEKAPPPKHPDQMAYALHPAPGPVMIVGAGGGRDVRVAIDAGAKQIFATEVDAVIVDQVVRERLRKHAGDLYDRPDVHVIVTDARGYAARNPASFQTIVSSLVDTGAAGAGVTLVRSESGIYTVEGMRSLLEALTPDGALVVNRWDEEAPRLLALLAEALRGMGVENPRSHLYAASHQRSTAFLVSRAPLSEEQTRLLRSFCRKARFREVLAPDMGRDDLEALLADPAAAYGTSERDLAPPTDDRPFFFHGVRPDRLLAALRDPEVAKKDPMLWPAAILTGFGLLALIVLGAVAALRGRRRGPVPGGLAFFGCAGAAYALLQAALVQRLASFVAHPTHALMVVLLSLVVGGAFGAAIVRHVPAASLEGVVARRAQLLAVLASVLALTVGPLLAAGSSLSAGGRAIVAFLLCLPLGVLTGALAPLARRALSSWSPARAALAAGVGGAAALLATGLGAVLALHVGLSFLLLLAAVLYLVASVLNPWPAHQRA